jgi:tRNA dimethylallyltransferase
MSRPTPLVIAIFGPTASGKSAVAAATAQRIPAEVVSADSMQIYRGLPILTAQPAGPARLVSIWPLTHEGSVGEYQRLAHAAIDEILAAGRTPLVVGGTGLYFRAALAELGLPPQSAPEARSRWEAFYDDAGPQGAHAALADVDPAAATTVHPNDRRRVVRALELTEAGSSLARNDDRLWAAETRRPTLVLGLELSAETLEQRIRRRAERMIASGVEEEVRNALEAGVGATARYALGLDVLATLPREEALEALVVRTRRYAAYQRKWMRRIPGLVRLDAERSPGEVADEIVALARARQRLRARRAG